MQQLQTFPPRALSECRPRGWQQSTILRGGDLLPTTEEAADLEAGFDHEIVVGEVLVLLFHDLNHRGISIVNL